MRSSGSGRRPKSPPARAHRRASVGGYTRGKQRRLQQCGCSSAVAAVRLQQCGCGKSDFSGSFCMAVSRFLAKRIQVGFFGIRPLDQEPALSCEPPHLGRWVYEKALWGGRLVHTRRPSTAAFAGCPGPISYIAAFAWCPTVCRGTDDCGEHHPSTEPAAQLRARHLGRLFQAQGNTPCAPGGGLCG